MALLDVATMIKASLREQWKAIDAVLVARGLPSQGVEDDLCGDDELLALRPALEAGRTKMKVATAAAARASKRYDERHPSMVAAYAKQSVAVDADRALADRVAGMRARTKEGIRFKQEVRTYWHDCELPDIDRSIHVDLISYVEASMNLPRPKVHPTQGLLTSAYDAIDTAIDLIEAAYQVTHGPDITSAGGDAMRAVLEAAKSRARAAKDTLHDTIAWVE